MFSALEKLNPAQRRVIRILYLLVIVCLAGFAFYTWRQLQALRSVPVALPDYWFYIVQRGDKMLIQTNGTWMVSTGNPQRNVLQTSTIECQQERMLCIESTAVVSTTYGTVLETVPRIHEVETWNESGVVTKPLASDCSAHVLTLSLPERTVTAATTLLPGFNECKDAPRTLKLDNGSKARAAAGK